MSEFISPSDAFTRYGLRTDRETRETELEQTLREHGIASVEMPLSPDDFDEFSKRFETAMTESKDGIVATSYVADSRFGSDAGYVRKEKKYSPTSGLQTSDAKNYFHFTETARARWDEQFAHAPASLKEFLAAGYEIHHALLAVAKRAVSEMEPTHPNISRLYFPNNDSFSFLRLLRYDGYEPDDSLGEVAKPHFDLSGVTIQAYADAPGFWAARDGVNGLRRHYDTAPNQAYTFLGKGHEKIYGRADQLKPLWHGVDRVVPEEANWVNPRTAVILFVDAPEVNYHLAPSDTLPHLGQTAARDLVGAGV